MTSLRHTGRDPDPKWQFLSTGKVDAWRAKVNQNLHNKERRQVEYEIGAVAAHQGWEGADIDGSGNPILEKPAPEEPRPGRETVEIMTKTLAEQMVIWSAQNPTLYMDKIRQMKERGGLGHLTDEQAAGQVLTLCRKVCEMDARRIYEELDLLRKA